MSSSFELLCSQNECKHWHTDDTLWNDVPRSMWYGIKLIILFHEHLIWFGHKTLKTRLKRSTDIHFHEYLNSYISYLLYSWLNYKLETRVLPGLIWTCWSEPRASSFPRTPTSWLWQDLQWPEPPQTKRLMLEQAGEQHTSRSAVIPRRTEAGKERDSPGGQSAAADTARGSMLERTTRAAVHISMDCRACSEHCVTEYAGVISITVRSAVCKPIRGKKHWLWNRQYI